MKWLKLQPRSEQYRDRDMLRAYLEDSKHAFEKNVSKPRDERYLMVMEDVLSEIVDALGLPVV